MMRRAVLPVLVLLWCTPALAQPTDGSLTTYVPEGEIEQRDGEAGTGLTGSLVVAGNINLASNSNVVGQVDGYSLLLGAALKGTLEYISGPHELINTLSITQAWARTPVLDEFVKSNDVLAFEALYNFFALDWFGPFARLNFETSMLPSEDIRAEATDFNVLYNDDTTEFFAQSDRIELSGAFQPFSLEQSVGAFVEPYQSKPFSVSVRVGAGGRETIADGVLVNADDSETEGIIELKELSNVYQAGAEVFVGFGGKVLEDRLSYDAGASVMFPFLNNDEDDRGIIDLTKWVAFANASVSVFEWMSLNYQFKLVKDPQLLDEVQLQNNLLLTFNYTLIERQTPPPPPEPTPEEKAAAEAAAKAAADAEAKTKAAEDKATAAEEKARQLEEELKKLREQPKPEPVPEPTPEPPPAEGDGATPPVEPAPTNP